MADSNSWVERSYASLRQRAESTLDVLAVDAQPPIHAGSFASPYMTGQFRRWLAEADPQQSQEPQQPRINFSLLKDSSIGEVIIAGFADNPGEVILGLPVDNR